MNAQTSAALHSTEQSLAASEYIVSVLENGAVCYEELDTIVLDFDGIGYA